jgi:hypothetical protein
VRANHPDRQRSGRRVCPSFGTIGGRIKAKLDLRETRASDPAGGL